MWLCYNKSKERYRNSGFCSKHEQDKINKKMKEIDLMKNLFNLDEKVTLSAERFNELQFTTGTIQNINNDSYIVELENGSTIEVKENEIECVIELSQEIIEAIEAETQEVKTVKATTKQIKNAMTKLDSEIKYATTKKQAERLATAQELKSQVTNEISLNDLVSIMKTYLNDENYIMNFLNGVKTFEKINLRSFEGSKTKNRVIIKTIEVKNSNRKELVELAKQWMKENNRENEDITFELI
jgi:hypothetical protein